MQQLEKLRKYIKDFKQTTKYTTSEEKKADPIDKILALFAGEVDRDLTAIDRFNLTKIILLHYSDKNIEAFVKFTGQPFIDIVFDELIRELNKFSESLNVFILLENLGFFNREICELLVKNDVGGNLASFKYILIAIKKMNIKFTLEILENIIKSFNLRRILEALFKSLDKIKKIMKSDESEISFSQLEKLTTLAEQNIQFLLMHITKNTSDDHCEIYYYLCDHKPSYDVNKAGGLLAFNAHSAFHEAIHQFLYENYLYSFSEIQDASQAIVSEAIPCFSRDVLGLVSGYNFFRHPKESLIRMSNPISLHFLHESKNADHTLQVNQFQKTIEGLGSFAIKFVEQILLSLDIKNFHPIILGGKGVSNHLEFLTQLTLCWPTSEEYRYVGVIVPTLPNPEGIRQHATTLLFDLRLITLEMIDSLDFLQGGLKEITRWVKTARLIYKDIDSTAEDKDQITEPMINMAKRLSQFKEILPSTKAPVQQTDQHTGVLHCVANLLGMILFKENKKMDPKLNSDQKAEQFLKSIRLDLSRDDGISTRSSEFLRDVAGIMHLVRESIPEEKHHPSVKI